ncbi:neuromedin-U isoform X2 [Nycticebus coucang]|uniref:neuromedin-U isoform X2 n=1 Tax=Nycticebus coucang TaxID=9470 RepID=UPI00234DBAC3|nr:neuromedin-U isoform X2 [Nycticebus coucang]
MPRAASRRPGSPPGLVSAWSPLLLLLLVCCADAGRGALILPQELWPEQEELQLWNEIDDACSPFLLVDYQPQASKVLEELCFALLGTLPKPRFLFHYSKTRKFGNSNVVSSVVHPLLQLVPQLNARRMKRLRANEKFQSPFAGRSRGYFLFRPRNGRRSAGLI